MADAGLVREALETNEVEGELVLIADGDQGIRHIQAVEAQGADCPDLVIVDINLPKRSGHEVLQSIREGSKCRKVTVVVLSSSDAESDQAEALSLGADHYVRKPLHLKDFLSLGAMFKALLRDRIG